MIKVFCIDNTQRPNEIPISKWIKKGKIYHVVFVTKCFPQVVLGYELHEVKMDADCLPYRYFQSTRFSVREEDIQKLLDMLNENEVSTDSQIQKLLESLVLENFDVSSN